MVIHRSYECQPPWVRNARNTRFTIIIFYMMKQPFNRIPGISAFINRIFIGSMYQRLMDLHFALAFIFTTDILEDQKVAILQE